MLEAGEHMAIVAEAISYDLTDVSGYELYSEFCYGSNGSSPFVLESAAGAPPDDAVFGSVNWDPNAANGIDSGWKTIELIVHLDSGGSTIQWSVAGTTLEYAGAAFNTIEQIQIRSAVVNTQAALSWDALTVKFYSNGTQTDSYSSQTGPTVDQTSQTNPGTLEKLVTITPQSSTNVDEVRITANVKLTAPQGVPIGYDSFFGQVLIDAA